MGITITQNSKQDVTSSTRFKAHYYIKVDDYDIIKRMAKTRTTTRKAYSTRSNAYRMQELLAIFLRTGCKGIDVVTLLGNYSMSLDHYMRYFQLMK